MPVRRACDVCYKRKIQCLIPNPGQPCDWCSNQGIRCVVSRKTPAKKDNKTTHKTVKDLNRRIEQLEARLAREHSLIEPNPRPRNDHAVAGPLTTRGGSVHHPKSLSSTSPKQLKQLASPAATASALTASTPTVVNDPVSAHSNDTQRSGWGNGLGLERIWWFKGLQILSERGQRWMAAKSGQEESTVVDKYMRFHTKAGLDTSKTTQMPQPAHVEIPQHLPNEATTRELVDYIFHKTVLRELIYPMLDTTLLEETVSEAYQCPYTSLSQTCARACVWALFAVASQDDRLKDLIPSSFGDGIPADAAQQLLLGHAMACPCSNSLQAALMLQAYRSSQGQTQSATMLLSIACRIVCTIGGHTDQAIASHQRHDDLAEPRAHHTRALFWLCYILDKDTSLRFGQPPLLTSDYCDLTLPPSDSWLDPEQPSAIHAVNQFLNRLATDPKLSMIKERTCCLTCFPSVTVLSDNQILLSIRQLDDELEHWRLSVPQLLRPSLAVQSDGLQHLSLEGQGIEKSMRYVKLQLEYHHVLIIIHSTVRRCGASLPEDEPLPDHLHSVVHSSIDLSLEASRSTLLFLRYALGLLKEDAVWYVYRYAPLAAMSLFVNILIHPLDPRAQDDLDVLSAAAATVRMSWTCKLSGEDTTCLQELCELILEQVRLGSSVIWNSKGVDTV